MNVSDFWNTYGPGILGNIILNLVIVLAVFWILFPILVNAKLKKLIRLQSEANSLLQAIRDGRKT